MLSWLFSDPLPPGTPAPAFSLPDEKGNLVTLSELRGSNVVLVWYPGDDTSVCRKQLCEIRDQWGALRQRNVKAFGINPQNPGSHEKFRSKFQFPFPLLVDKGQEVGKLYHTNGLIVKRTVYLIDKEGIIRYGKRGKPELDEVLKGV